ncbi:MAG TPA: hypothetical protein VG965_06920 [Patescibacteria group bacterium]|nr:hypothetical protein [Patescibacteria group bacterium]
MKYEDAKLPDLKDNSLTPENAEERGYKYIGEVIYQMDAPYETMKEVIEMVDKDKFKLGCSLHNPDTEFCGIYESIK